MVQVFTVSQDLLSNILSKKTFCSSSGDCANERGLIYAANVTVFHHVLILYTTSRRVLVNYKLSFTLRYFFPCGGCLFVFCIILILFTFFICRSCSDLIFYHIFLFIYNLLVFSLNCLFFIQIFFHF